MKRSAPSLSIILPTWRRTHLLKRCLESIRESDPEGLCEILVVVNGPDPESERLLSDLKAAAPRLKIVRVPRSSRGAARNRAVAEAGGDFCYFVDDDVVLRPETLSALKRSLAADPAPDVVGGPNLTPPGCGPFERAAGFVWGSLFGAWRMRLRTSGAGREGPADDASLQLCNLCIKRHWLNGGGLRFNEQVVSAEENLLLSQLLSRGARVRRSPAMAVYHRRRSDWRGFCRQLFLSGAGRFQVMRLFSGCFSPIYLLPSFFLIYLLSLAWLANGLTLWPLWLYLSILCGHALYFGARHKSFRGLFWTLMLFPTCHLAYGLGMLLGWAVGRGNDRAQSRS